MKKKLCRVFLPRHSAKHPFPGCWEMALPSAKGKTLGKNMTFAECIYKDTRQRLQLCPVPVRLEPLPSAFRLALGETYANRYWAGRFTLCCRVPEKRHSAKLALSSDCLPSVCCRVLRSANSSRRVYKVLCQVSLTLGKPPISRSKIYIIE